MRSPVWQASGAAAAASRSAAARLRPVGIAGGRVGRRLRLLLGRPQLQVALKLCPPMLAHHAHHSCPEEGG